MPFALSSWSFHSLFHAGDFSLLDVPARASSFGFAHVELNDFMLPAPPLSNAQKLLGMVTGKRDVPAIERYNDDILQQLRAALDSVKVSCLCWTLDTDFTVPDEQWQMQQHYIEQGVKAAHLLDAKIMRLTLGGSDKKESRESKEIEELIANRLAQVVAAHPDLLWAVENHWGVSTNTDFFLQVIIDTKARLGSHASRLGVCFDPGNTPVQSRLHHWEQLAEQAVHFHLKTTAFDDNGDETTLDYYRLVPMLKRVGYEGSVVLEYEGKDGLADGIRHSVKLFRKIFTHARTGRFAVEK
ncbi:MAG: TIM barrel protein [Chloroflexota bacterium]